MIKLIAGLDETATETQKLEGWCHFCIPQSEYIKFENEAQLLLDTTTLTSFHGKKFKIQYDNEYEQFLHIIRKYVESSTPSILSCVLYCENFKQTYFDFSKQVTNNTLKTIGVTDANFIDVFKQLTPSLFEFMRLINHFGNNYDLTIEIDDDTVKARFPTLNTTIKTKNYTADALMEKLYNNYRKLKFPNSPLLSNGGIKVLRDQHSLAVQASDIIGHFSTSYIYYKLGNTSTKRKRKGEIFEKVFGDKFNNIDFSSEIKLVGQNDLELINSINGSIKMEFTAYTE